jgi:hypothetical protein
VNDVGSSGKKRTTMAKLNREGKLREKRFEKEARKAARRLSAGSDAAEAASRPGQRGPDMTSSFLPAASETEAIPFD